MTRMHIDSNAADLKSLLARVEAGEEIVLVRAGKPVAKLSPCPEGGLQERVLGLDEGLFRVPGDFDDPLPDEILQGFNS